MKKEVWDIEKLPNGEFILSSCGDELTTKDLKDLRSLIDTVLGEDCSHKKSALSKSTRWGTRKICNSCGQDWKKEWDSQPLTEGEGEEFPLNNVVGLPIGEDVIVKLEDGRIIEGTIKTRTQQESNKEEVRMGATGKPPFGLYEEPSKKEEEVPQKILINGDIIGICKKGFRVTKEECIGCERGVKHVCIPEPSKKPICYCGHPKERHFIQYKSLVEGNQLSCRHCECFEYADNELHNQGKI